MKKAPYYNQQVKQCEPFNDWLILVGDTAKQAYYRNNEAGKGTHWQMIREHYGLPIDYVPVMLDGKTFQEIDRLQLAPAEQRSIKLFQVGKIPTLAKDKDDLKTRILMNLAKHNGRISSIEWLDEALQGENLYQDLERIKQGHDTVAEVLEQKKTDSSDDYEDYFNHLGDNGKVNEFLKWYKTPIKRHDQSGEIYQYTGKKWELLELEPLGREIRKFFIAKNIKRYSAVKIKKMIDLFTFELDETEERNPNLLAFENGILNKLTGEFMPHSERYFITSFINAEYRTEAQSTPHFDKWLHFVSNGDTERARTILAGLFMVLINADKWQLFVEVTGAGGTGKSTYTEIAKLLSGDDNHVGITLKALDHETQRCIVIDKTLIISGDQQKYLGDGATIRAITGGDDIFFNPKHKKPFSRKINAIFMTTNNTPIVFTENSGGTERRRVIFKFDRIVPVEERDYNLLEKIRAETGGIIRLLFDTFPEPLEAKALLEKQRTSAEALAVKIEVNHVLDFAQAFETKPIINGLPMGNVQQTNGELMTAIYPSYRYFCSLSDIEPINRRAFSKAFKQALRELGRGEYQTRESNGKTITNVFFIDKTETLNKWQS